MEVGVHKKNFAPLLLVAKKLFVVVAAHKNFFFLVTLTTSLVQEKRETCPVDQGKKNSTCTVSNPLWETVTWQVGQTKGSDGFVGGTLDRSRGSFPGGGWGGVGAAFDEKSSRGGPKGI